jgi:ornithine cyclodeaminase
VKSAHRLLLVGSGRIATELAFAYRAVRDIRHVEVFSPTPGNAERLVHHLRAHGFDAEVCGDLEAGVKGADIIACATLSIEPLVRGAWLKAGQHVALIGGYTPAMREADDATMGNAVWIDSAAALGEAGDLIGPGLTLESVRGTLRDLCEVAATKDCDEVVTVFKSVGDASQDLAAATLALGM